jgi:nucleoside-diphosphate-sugar epimerase
MTLVKNRSDILDVLITGISGFVGSNLLNYLKSDDSIKITGSSRDISKISHLKNTIKEVCSYSKVYSEDMHFDVYVHLSGKVHDESNMSSEADYMEANYVSTKKLFESFLNDKKAKKFIFLSTIHVLTECPERELDESYTPAPFTPYGRSKYRAEQYIEKNCPPEKDYYILRPSMIHGAGNKGNLNLLYKFVTNNLPYPVGAYNNKRTFVSAENLCFVISELIKQDIKKGLYHVADDEPTYTHDLVKLIAELTGSKGKIWNINPLWLKTIAKIGNILPIPINEHRLNKLTGDFIVSNKKLIKALNKTLPVKSKDGITKTIKSFNN